MSLIFKHFLLLASILFLTACGGYDLSGNGDKDVTPPVITILGNTTQTVEVGVACQDSGATAMDDRDGYIQVVVSGTVDLSTPGTYIITYTATDSSGNSATAVRTVYVVEINHDHTPPVITLNGSDEVYVEVGESYFEQNATAIDNEDGNLTSSIRIWTEHEVKTNQIGDYEVIYTVTDSAGNSAEERRGIHVLDSTTALKITIETNQTGDSTDTQFIVPTNSAYEYDYKIFCGNDEYEVNYVEHVTGDYVCNYYDPGKYTIYIKGKFPAIYHHYSAEANETLSVDQWGEIEWKSMESAFAGCGKLRINATDIPNLSSVTNMQNMFHEAHSINDPIDDWNVSSVTNMAGVFAGALTFNQALNHWDVSHVTEMNWMFSNAHDFNQSLNDWNVCSVQTMEHMFKEAFNFNGNIIDWDVKNVKNMHQMFHEAFAFNQPIGDWNVSNVTDMSGMFRNAYCNNNSSFNQDLSRWDISNVTDMSYMFKKAESFNQPLSWGNKTANVTNMEGMFYGTKNFNQDIGGWDVSSVINMAYMFKYAINFNQYIGGWDVGSVITMNSMFKNASDFNQSIGDWGNYTSNVANMTSMFENAISFDQDVGPWCIRSITSMASMFHGVTLSSDVYSDILGGWNACGDDNIPDGIIFDAGSSQYESSAQSDRDNLTDVNGWIITDGGEE